MGESGEWEDWEEGEGDTFRPRAVARRERGRRAGKSRATDSGTYDTPQRALIAV